jgi:hypothetical protein
MVCDQHSLFALVKFTRYEAAGIRPIIGDVLLPDDGEQVSAWCCCARPHLEPASCWARLEGNAAACRAAGHRAGDGSSPSPADARGYRPAILGGHLTALQLARD